MNATGIMCIAALNTAALLFLPVTTLLCCIYRPTCMCGEEDDALG